MVKQLFYEGNSYGKWLGKGTVYTTQSEGYER